MKNHPEPISFAALRHHRVMVTGATGFIGKHLCRLCVDSGAEVIGVGRSSITGDLQLASIDWRQLDLTDSAGTLQLLEETRPTIIFHLAGYASASRDTDAILPTLASNLVSTVNVLHAGVRIGSPRIVLTGSLEETLDPGAEPPSSPYAASKTAMSMYARMFHQLYQLPVTLARTFMVYGPEQADVKKLVPYVITSQLRNQSPLLSSGARDIDWIYVEDVASGFVSAALSQQAIGQTVDIGSGAMVSIRQIVQMIADMIGATNRPKLGALPDRPFEQLRQADVARTFELTGWRPAHSLESGLAKTIAWYQTHSPESLVQTE